MKNSNGTIGNRTRDLPACCAVPQPTAPPRLAPNKFTFKNKTFALNTGLRPVLRLGIFKRHLYNNMLFYTTPGGEWLTVVTLTLPVGEEFPGFNGQQTGGAPEPCLDKMAKELSDQGGYNAYSTDGKNEKRRQNCSKKS